MFTHLFWSNMPCKIKDKRSSMFMGLFQHWDAEEILTWIFFFFFFFE